MHRRRPFHSTAHIVFADRQRLAVRTFDISLGGLGIVADLNPLPGTLYAIELNIALRSCERHQLQTPVQVVHSIFGTMEQSFRIGLRFVDVEPVASTIALYLAD